MANPDPTGKTRKPLPTSMDAVSTILMWTMLVSQSVAWYGLTQAQAGRIPLYTVTAAAGAFYASWAALNLYTRKPGQPHDLGLLTMGLMAAASLAGSAWGALVAGVLIVLNFAVPATVVLGWSASKLAHKRGKPLIHAYVFKVYFISSLAFWSTVCFEYYTSLPSE